jgi:NADH:ubiquinone reductase (H+-translocating)
VGVRPRIVIVGAGFGGINAAKALSSGPFDVTLIDRHNYHGFWPLLYQVATAGLGPEDIAHPVRGIFGNRRNVHVRLGTVTGVDFAHRTVAVDDDALPYDYLILAAGTATNDFGIPGVGDHAFPLKSLADAVRLRNHILTCFERADASPSLIDGGILSIVLVGGGPTGVEMAGALSELVSRNFAFDFPRLDTTRARIVLVEMGGHLLSGFSARSQEHARRTLEHKGVEVLLDSAVREVSASHVLLDGSVITSGTVIWTAGVKAAPLADALALGRGRGGSMTVERDLSVAGHPEVFVVGDLAAATDRHGDPYPQVAQVAIQSGRHAARSITRRAAGKSTRPFRYHDHGSMATIGRRAAVAELPLGINLRGTPGWFAWLGVHLVFLIGFRNRAVVLINWAWNYLTWDRGSRIILEVDTTGDGRDGRRARDP